MRAEAALGICESVIRAVYSVTLGARDKGLISLEVTKGQKPNFRGSGTVRNHRPRGGHVSGLPANPAIADRFRTAELNMSRATHQPAGGAAGF